MNPQCIAVDRKFDSAGVAGHESTPECFDICSGRKQL